MSVPVSRTLEMLNVLQNGVLQKLTQYFTYTMLFSGVASAANATAQLQIDAASDFLVVGQSFNAVDDVTTLAVSSAALIQINDSGSGTTLWNIPTPIPNLFGTAQLPFLLPMPRLFTANATMTGTLNNQTTANATSFYLSFHGIKIWK